MDNNVKALTTTKPDLFTLAPRNLEEAWKYAELIAESDMVPKDFRGKPGNILVAVQMGAELGLPPTQAIQNIAVINGRPALWGDAVLALVTASAECKDIIETDDGHTATCTIKRRNKSDVTRTFSMDDAKKAGLAGKQGPWTQYPARMRQMRARSFAVRDAFPHLLKGISVAEEVQDISTAPRDVTPVPEKKPEALPPYPQADFDRNLPTWREKIQAGKTTAAKIISKVSTRGPLSEDMKKKIRDCENIDAEETAEQEESTTNAASQTDEEWYGDYDKAKGGEQP